MRAFQRRATPSFPPVTTDSPSGEKTATFSGEPWASRATSLPVRLVDSRLPAFGCHEHERTVFVCSEVSPSSLTQATNLTSGAGRHGAHRPAAAGQHGAGSHRAESVPEGDLESRRSREVRAAQRQLDALLRVGAQEGDRARDELARLGFVAGSVGLTRRALLVHERALRLLSLDDLLVLRLHSFGRGEVGVVPLSVSAGRLAVCTIGFRFGAVCRGVRTVGLFLRDRTLPLLGGEKPIRPVALLDGFLLGSPGLSERLLDVVGLFGQVLLTFLGRELSRLRERGLLASLAPLRERVCGQAAPISASATRASPTMIASRRCRRLAASRSATSARSASCRAPQSSTAPARTSW